VVRPPQMGWVVGIGLAWHGLRAMDSYRSMPTTGLSMMLGSSVSLLLRNWLCAWSRTSFIGFNADTRTHLATRNPENQTAINAVNAFATMLAARFSPVVGCTRSWDAPNPTDFQVRTPGRITTIKRMTSQPHKGYH